jgi:hypothetical protein
VTSKRICASRCAGASRSESHIVETLRIKPERHHLVQGSSRGSGGLLALSQVGG